MDKLIGDTQDWDKLKQRIYHEDGSLRDIYVLNTTTADWLKWIAFINENYNLTWTAEEYNEEVPEKIIDASFIIRRWQSEMLATCASVFLGGIQVNCFFFTDIEIENDIDPREINSIDDHHRLINYLQAISKLLGKEVLLTEENYGALELEEVLIRVRGEEIFISK